MAEAAERALAERVLALAQEYRRRHSPLTIERIAAGIGFSWRVAPLAGRDGMLETRSRTILLASSQTPARQRFTAAHEVMHYLIESDDEVLSELHEQYAGAALERALERLCNRGAAEMLLPRAEVLQALRKDGPNPRLLWELAGRFGVSEAAAAVAVASELGPGTQASVWGGRPLRLYFAFGAVLPPRGLALSHEHPLAQVAAAGLPYRGPLELARARASDAWARLWKKRVYVIARGVVDEG